MKNICEGLQVTECRPDHIKTSNVKANYMPGGKEGYLLTVLELYVELNDISFGFI